MEQYSKIFKSLSDKTRLRIMRLLLKSGRELCICEIMDSLGLAQYNVSKHVRELKNTGLVQERKEGRFVMYSLVKNDIVFFRQLTGTIKSIPEKHFSGDFRRLKHRLSLRERGKCVMGSIRKKGCEK